MVAARSSIRRKLITAMMLTSSIVLCVTAVLFITYEVVSFKQTLRRYLSTLAQIMAANNTANMVYQGQRDAEEILNTLRAEPYIVRACLYDTNGHFFASFPRSLGAGGFPERPEPDGMYAQRSTLSIFRPVMEAGKPRLGTLYIEMTLQAMYEQLKLYAGIVVAILLSTTLIAYALATALQKRISEPILALAEVARQVSNQRDYSVRAPKLSEDEIGLLTDAFNHMLSQIHERDRALRGNEARFRGTFEQAAVGIAHIDLEGRWVRVNQKLCDLFGYSREEFYSKTFRDLSYPDDIESDLQNRRRLLEGEIRTYSSDKRFVRKDGSTMWATLTVSLVEEAAGVAPYFICVIEEITARKKAEQEILRLNSELEERVLERTSELATANRELEAFTYSVSHDLRGPLRHIDAYAKILEEECDPELSEQGRKFIQRIRHGVQNMGRLVDDLLNLARVGRQELVAQVTGFNSLLDEVLDELKSEMENRQIEWRIGPLPFAECDPGLMKQVFTNLVSNAIKYTRPRPVAIIEIGQTEIGGTTAVYVRDNGVGFSMKYAGKLFGVFQRLHRPEDFEGTGVGLATVDRIVRKHGGKVWAEAELDKGATFYFTLGTHMSSRNPNSNS